MTFDLRAWQARHAFTYDTAAQALGFDRATYARYLKKPELPRWLVLACMAIDAGIRVDLPEKPDTQSRMAMLETTC